MALLRTLPLERPKILDFGCGYGWFTGVLAKFGETTGIDLSDEAIAAARAQFPDVRFIAGNLYDVALPADSFDLVVSQEVLSHVHDQVGYIEKAAYVLKPGGCLIVTTDNRFVMERLGDVVWEPQPPEHIEHYLTMGELKRLLRPRFEIVRETTIIPLGQRGILRFANSPKLTGILAFLVGRARVEGLKEWAGFGYKLVVLARKRLRG